MNPYVLLTLFTAHRSRLPVGDSRFISWLWCPPLVGFSGPEGVPDGAGGHEPYVLFRLFTAHISRPPLPLLAVVPPFLASQDLKDCRMELEGMYNLMGVADPSRNSGEARDCGAPVVLPSPLPRLLLVCSTVQYNTVQYSTAPRNVMELCECMRMRCVMQYITVYAAVSDIVQYMSACDGAMWGAGHGPVEGECLVYRNPGLVAEDILKLRAVARPKVRALLPLHAQHCIIFSTKGPGQSQIAWQGGPGQRPLCGVLRQEVSVRLLCPAHQSRSIGSTSCTHGRGDLDRASVPCASTRSELQPLVPCTSVPCTPLPCTQLPCTPTSLHTNSLHTTSLHTISLHTSPLYTSQGHTMASCTHTCMVSFQRPAHHPRVYHCNL